MVPRFVLRGLLRVVIVCLGWQSLGLAGVGAWLVNADDRSHQLLHVGQIAHHHHADHLVVGVHDPVPSHDSEHVAVHEDSGHAGLSVSATSDEGLASALHMLAEASLFAPALPSLHGPVCPPNPLGHPPAVRLTARPLLLANLLDRPPNAAG